MKCDTTEECKSFTYRDEDSACYFYSDRPLSELKSGPGWNKSKEAGAPYDEADCHRSRQYVKIA